MMKKIKFVQQSPSYPGGIELGKFQNIAQKYYIGAPEAAEALELSEGKVYEIFRELNEQLKAQGFITVSGRVPRAYFNQKFFGGFPEQGGG